MLLAVFSTTINFVAALAVLCAAQAHISWQSEFENFKCAKALPANKSNHSASRINPTWPNDVKRVLLVGDCRIQQKRKLPNIEGVAFKQAGIGGETTFELNARIELFVDRSKPDVVFVQIGINALVTALGAPGLRAPIESAVIEHMRSIAQILTDRRIEVHVLQIVRPSNIGFKQNEYDWFVDLVDRVSEQVESELGALGISIVRSDDAFVLRTESGNANKQYYSDALHFNVAGYDVLKSLLVDSLQTSKSMSERRRGLPPDMPVQAK